MPGSSPVSRGCCSGSPAAQRVCPSFFPSPPISRTFLSVRWASGTRSIIASCQVPPIFDVALLQRLGSPFFAIRRKGSRRHLPQSPDQTELASSPTNVVGFFLFFLNTDLAMSRSMGPLAACSPVDPTIVEDSPSPPVIRFE